MLDNSIQNLIFDLGGVLLDLHFDRCHEAFARLAGSSVEEIKSKIAGTSSFVEHEKGLISDGEFRDGLRVMLNKDWPDQEIDMAWNAILGDIPQERLQLVQSLRKDYQVFLLSNTNSIHLPLFAKMVYANTGQPSLESFFDKTYYSHVLKMRKPDEEIFRHVLEENKLVPENTLFLDDYPVNLAGAEKTGMKTFHVQSPQSVFEIFA